MANIQASYIPFCGNAPSSLAFVCGPHGLRSPIEDILVEAVDTICALYRQTGRKLEPFLKHVPRSLQEQLQEAFAEVDVESLGVTKAKDVAKETQSGQNGGLRLAVNGRGTMYIDEHFSLPLHVPEYDHWYCKCCSIEESDWVPWHVDSADKYNVSISMLKSLGVPLSKGEMLDEAVGLDEDDVDENMEGNEELLEVKEKIENLETPEVIRRDDYVVYDVSMAAPTALRSSR